MRIVVALAGSLLALWAFQTVVSNFTLTIYHPIWNIRATMIGGAIGLAVILLLILLERKLPAATKSGGMIAGILFVVAMAVTWYYAGIFVNSANFEAFAGQIWFFGYIAAMAMLVPVVALVIRRGMRTGA